MIVRLYTRPGCHLCETVEDALRELAGPYPHELQRIDIDADPVMTARYSLTIPVVVVDLRYTLAAQITPEALAQVLDLASRRRAG